MKITARTDYALRAALALAEVHPRLLKGEVLAEQHGLPVRFLENILLEMRRAGVVGSRRGTDGGYWLSLPPDQVTVADVARSVGGFLVDDRDEGSAPLPYSGAARNLGAVWVLVSERVRGIVESLTLADVLEGSLDLTGQAGDGARKVASRSIAVSASATKRRTSSPAPTSSPMAPAP